MDITDDITEWLATCLACGGYNAHTQACMDAQAADAEAAEAAEALALWEHLHDRHGDR